jgi:hypothetical protein
VFKRKAKPPQVNISKLNKDFIKEKKMRKPDVVAILFLRNNGMAEIIYREPREGMFEINGKSYHERMDCRYFLTMGKDRYPLAVIPEWSLIPLGTEEFRKMPEERKFAELQDHVIKGIRNAEIVRQEGDQRKPLNAKTIVVLVIIGVIGLALLRSYI